MSEMQMVRRDGRTGFDFAQPAMGPAQRKCGKQAGPLQGSLSPSRRGGFSALSGPAATERGARLRPAGMARNNANSALSESDVLI
jgi:hypothetical protein